MAVNRLRRLCLSLRSWDERAAFHARRGEWEALNRLLPGCAALLQALATLHSRGRTDPEAEILVERVRRHLVDWDACLSKAMETNRTERESLGRIRSRMSRRAAPSRRNRPVNRPPFRATA